MHHTHHTELTHDYETIIIGGSAAGLSAALMLGRARRRTLVIDAGNPRNRFATHMHGVLGHDGLPPHELVARGRDEAARYGVEIIHATVTAVHNLSEPSRPSTGLLVQLNDGREFTTATMIVATGITDILPKVGGLSERWGSTVLHCPFCHGYEIADQRLGVLAAGPASLHQVQVIRQWSDDVIFFTASLGKLDQAVADRLTARGITIVEAGLSEVYGPDTSIDSVRTTTGETFTLDALYLASTAQPHDEFLSQLHLDRTDHPFDLGSFIAVSATGQTSHPRVWAVGNVVSPLANVPVASGAGSLAGGAVNGFLCAE